MAYPRKVDELGRTIWLEETTAAAFLLTQGVSMTAEKKPVTLTKAQLEYAVQRAKTISQERVDKRVKALGTRPAHWGGLDDDQKVALIASGKAKLRPSIGYRYGYLTDSFSYPESASAKAANEKAAKFDANVDAIKVDEEKKLVQVTDALYLSGNGQAALAALEAFAAGK